MCAMCSTSHRAFASKKQENRPYDAARRKDQVHFACHICALTTPRNALTALEHN